MQLLIFSNHALENKRTTERATLLAFETQRRTRDTPRFAPPHLGLAGLAYHDVVELLLGDLGGLLGWRQDICHISVSSPGGRPAVGGSCPAIAVATYA